MADAMAEKETQEFLLKLAAAFLITAVGGVILKKTGFKLERTRRQSPGRR